MTTHQTSSAAGDPSAAGEHPPAEVPADAGGVIVGEIEEHEPPLPLNAGGKPELGPLVEQRFRLTRYLLITVATIAVVLLAAVMFTGESRLDALTSIAAIIFGPLVTLLGTSFAWYFAKNSE